ncbi:site-specific integrase, partial [Vibrio sp. 10N.222.55.E8]
MRHVATLSTVYTHTTKGATMNAELYQLPLTETPSTPNPSGRFQWPHKALIKYHQGKHKTRPPTPPCQESNLLPSLFYGFVNELFELGGIQRNTLQSDSIDRYTNFYQHLSPLSFACASDPETLHAWAHAQFAALQEQTTP